MIQKIFSGLLAAACVLSMGLPTFAVQKTPTLSKGNRSETITITQLYDVQEPILYEGVWKTVRGNIAYCAACETVCDDYGRVYRLKDSSPLSDSKAFSAKISVDVNPDMIRSVKLLREPANQEDTSLETLSRFAIDMSPDYIFERIFIEFTVTYTALQDTELTVQPAGEATEEVTFLAKKGAKIICTYQANLDGENMFVRGKSK
ncbi:MAG: hypothetical protein HFG20_05405 [Anaerotruncus sp.]|jgi:hypothetical protein|nr:hypothetical protein [Anaerotruncus sp.]